MKQEELFSFPDTEQIEIFYLLEEGERLKARAEYFTVAAIAEKYDYSEQWIRAVRLKLREVFGTYSDGYSDSWEEIVKRLEGG